MKIDNVISEVINRFLNEDCKMLKEYKNPKNSQTVRVCGDMLEGVYQSIVNTGVSKREITVETLGKIIADIRRLEQMMNM